MLNLLLSYHKTLQNQSQNILKITRGGAGKNTSYRVEGSDIYETMRVPGPIQTILPA